MADASINTVYALLALWPGQFGPSSIEQIIGVQREQEAGAKTADVCRKHGVSEATFYKWKAKCSGLEVSEAKRLRALEDENGRPKRMLADAMLNNAALKGLLGKSGNTRRATEGCGVFCTWPSR